MRLSQNKEKGHITKIDISAKQRIQIFSLKRPFCRIKISMMYLPFLMGMEDLNVQSTLKIIFTYSFPDPNKLISIPKGL